MAQTLVLISAKKPDQDFLAEICQAGGYSLKSATEVAQGCQLIEAETPTAIFVDASTEQDYRKFETIVQEKFGLFSDRIDPNKMFFLSEQDITEVPYLAKSPIFGHFVHRNYENLKDSGPHFARIVKAVEKERSWGLQALMSDAAKIQTVKLQNSAQKQDAVEAVKNYLLSAKFQARMASSIANAVDELLMNAIFDAPTDNMGKQLYANTPRDRAFALPGQAEVTMQVGYDGKYVGLTVMDQFGSLDKARLLSHIAKKYTEEEYQLKTAAKGAGLGLATVFQSGGSFFFVSEARVRTEVTVLFRRTPGYKEFKQQFRFLSTQFYF